MIIFNMISFDEDELKLYLENNTSYNIDKILSINDNYNWINSTFNCSDKIKITAICSQIVNKNKMFLYTDNIIIPEFVQFIRTRKLNNIK